MKFSYLYTWLSVFLIIVISSCSDKLELAPETTVSDANFWKTTHDLELACNYLYTYLPALGTSQDPVAIAYPYTEMYGNMVFGTASNTVSSGSWTPPASSNEWTGYYKLVRAANNILEKSANVSGAEVLVNKYKGEAYFFRAFAYFELMKRYGDVPFINRTLTLTDEMLYAERTNREILTDSIYADLNKAISFCPQPNVQATAEYGRITSTAALALKSRTALFEGTWNKFHNTGDAQKHLKIAIEAAGSIITGNKHSLYTAKSDSSYFYEFQYKDAASKANYAYADNKENILVRLYGQNVANNIIASNYSNDILGTTTFRPTRNLMDNYLFSDGLPAGKSKLDSTLLQTSSSTEFRNRDPRLIMSVYSPGIKFYNAGGVVYTYSQGISYLTRKYNLNGDRKTTTNFVNFNIIRYAEVLLNYIEAKYELNGTVTDSDLDLTINALRNRASNNKPTKLALISNAFATTNGLDMRTEIRRERKAELALEGFSYWDLLRWKTAETELPVAMLGPKYFTVMNSPNTPRDANGFIIYEAASKRTFNAARDYLWPVPTKELALNDKLTQNPNW